MRKKFLSIILVLALAISCSVQALAATYTDLSGHWAKTYLEDLANRGLLTGYSDGTMRPDSNMTTCQLLVLLSRMYTLTDVQKGLIEDDYGSVIQAAVPSTSSWAYANLDICLAAGIVTEDELKTLDLTGNVNKEQFSLFLTRTMQLTGDAEALSVSNLTYTDKTTISEACVGSVAELANLGIVKGNTKNQFLPKSNVTRAVAATMISRALDYLTNKAVTLTIAGYAGYTGVDGILTAAGSGTINLRGFDGYTREYQLPSAAAVTVNGSAGAINSGYVGQYAKITMKNGVVTRAAVNTDSSIKWVQGIFYSITSSTSTTTTITLKDADSGVKTDYKLSNTAAVTLNDKSSDISSLAYGNFVTIMLQGNAVTKVYAVSGDGQLSGKIAGIEYGTTTSFKVLGSDGGTYCFSLAIGSLPTIQRGDTAITIDQLKTGDAVTLTLKNFAISLIQGTDTASVITGELTAITATADVTNWVIATDSGSSVTLSLDENVIVTSGTTSVLLSAVQPGNRVTVTVYHNTIAKVALLSTESAATKVSGTVLYVDNTNRQITMLTPNGKLVYVSTATAASILVTSTGKTITLSSLQVGANMVAYGSYSSTSVFNAKSIIIE